MADPDDDRIDAELRRAFAPPPAVRFAEAARTVTGAARGRRPLWPWLCAAAAALVAVALLLGSDRRPRGPEGHDATELAQLWTAAYEHAITASLDGSGCCDPGADLARMCEERCGARLSFAGRDDVRLLGCYCGLPTGGCMGILLEVRGAPVSVFVVPRSRDPEPRPTEAASVAWTRRALGPLVLYALGPAPLDDVLAEFAVPAS